ncbi:MAG: AAA family ATPase [Planctomycetota bacterium]|jgi:adenylate kinase family enzyme
MARIHITGASGTGATTLGRALARELSCAHFDSDDYFWLPTQPPYREQRAPAERVRLLERDMGDAWVLSGSVSGWGDPLIPRFTAVVFLWVPQELRLERLRLREERENIPPDNREEFLAWAARYDNAGMEQRSRILHERWLETLTCPVLRLEGDLTTAERMRRVRASITMPP